MRIGLIADVHADFLALRGALTLFHNAGVDQIVCAGDLVEKGPHGDAVVSLIREQAILCVRGNHDAMAPDNQQWLRETASLTHRAVLLLNDETLAYLDTLPSSRIVEAGAQRLLIAHGTPSNDWEYLYPFGARSQFELVAEAALNFGTDVVVLGHTHEPMIAQIASIWVFNPGSVCSTHSTGSGTCGILTLPGYAFEVFQIATGRRVRAAYVSGKNLR